MALKEIIVAIGGVFVMLSFFLLMVGSLLLMENVFYGAQLLAGIAFAAIGFYLLGKGFLSE